MSAPAPPPTVPAGSAWRRSVVAVLLLAAGLQLALAWHMAWIGDDAFIAFRYGRNLAEGLGLRFNPAENPPVEGFTQLAWVLIVAAIEWLGLEVVAASRVVELALGLALLALATRAFLRSGASAVVIGVAALVLATSPGMVVWSTGGLGTMLFALSIFVAADSLLATARGGSIAVAAAASVAVTIVRFDGLYFAGVVLASGAALGLLRVEHRRLLRASVLGAVAVAVAFALQTAARVAYFGDWLPNTARAKGASGLRSLDRGVDYLMSNWLAVPLLAIGLAGAVVFVARTRGRDPWLVMALGVILGCTAYGILAGGDFMPMGRFFVPALPFVALISGQLVRASVARGGAGGGVVCAGALLLCSVPATFGQAVTPLWARELASFRWGWPYETERSFIEGMQRRAEEWALLGNALALHAAPTDSLVRAAIGAVGYHSRLTIHDQHGLVDREVTARGPPHPGRLTLPGHDFKVGAAFFSGREPTWLAAELLLGEHPGTALYERLRPAMDAGLVMAFPVEVAQGFPKPGTLVLVPWTASRLVAPPVSGDR